MTFGSLIVWIIIIYLFYLMMKKGGGCCGGHNHGDPKNNLDHKGHETKPIQSLEHHHEQQESDKTGKDPVCGMGVSNDVHSSDHRGKTFRFCSEQCRKLFDLNPNKYANL